MIASPASIQGLPRSCLYEGWVRHRRHQPRPHRFRYRLFMVCLDLAELPQLFDGRWLWSARRPAPAWFRRRDHLGDPHVPLDAAVRALVEERLGRRPSGTILLLTHLRYFGYCMNPVSFFYCFDADGQRLDAIVAEVHNTPWGERHCYVLDAAAGDAGSTGFRFDKAFHVSPFMPMEQRYAWRLSKPAESLAVHMSSLEADREVFDATMVLRRRPFTSANLTGVLLRHPFMTGKVIAAIYAQALRLRLKGIAFHPHPRHRRSMEELAP